eukprot:6482504-Amphidinium_carterae.1
MGNVVLPLSFVTLPFWAKTELPVATSGSNEEKRRLEREETEKRAKEKRQRYAKPEFIAELKHSEGAPAMPLAEEQRRQALLKKKQEAHQA